ncbi:hypothetical protein BO70DRAFT_389210 [Aspergillus heteromorphus CBS 117.55]|uniref:Calcineurin-like phosphoesterase domain-containing protein n=1 Tax=Aspergillus heteromorphus CBS 117.55 TaxID=1448321 RepID=A0A317VH97_9EURO|nr:uncharacterized protein BO70DRAFT_389210 [Aspergillus heteromorphus CBS 117.55]PWY73736.1 hypothetical protein BO70DRAFT_389210 [Aspergillus heteromorphus CBS 117.55]
MFHKAFSIPNDPPPTFPILSDLHLEVNHQYSSYDFPICATHLILAGDVGLFLVLGNHEFYGESFTEGIERARNLERESCFHGRLLLLHQRPYDIPRSNITVLGCTLWSDVPPQAQEIVQAKIRDFRKVRGWTVDDHNVARDYEGSRLVTGGDPAKTQTQQREVLVVTHHAPSLQGTSIWVFGHTHYTTEFMEGGVRVVSNQRGYVLPGSESRTIKDGFDARKAIRMS